ncbi:hypothetical protein BG74_08360 [Sodalis-like endosymbiont of Proechinophthirus fluctus]|nr:hypothetical protein BG74_08360 [Sodalis-like endosymbiont of Proechinophthirus fluctus]
MLWPLYLSLFGGCRTLFASAGSLALLLGAPATILLFAILDSSGLVTAAVWTQVQCSSHWRCHPETGKAPGPIAAAF